MAERMKGLVVDDALKPGTQIGPVVDQNQLDQDLSFLRIGVDEGAKLAVGGELQRRATPGFYMSPALFTDADNSMRIAREEIFGPVTAMIPARDYEHALALANDTEFGLCGGICTTSLKYATHFKRNIESGHGDGQSAHRRGRLSRAVRRPEGLQPRFARAGPLRRRVLYNRQDRLYAGLRARNRLTPGADA